MRKLLFIIVFLMSFSMVFSATKLNNANYESNRYTMDFNKKVPKYKLRYDKAKNIVVLEFEDTKSKSSIEENVTYNNEYLKGVKIVELDDVLVVNMELQNDVDYGFLRKSTEMYVSFRKKSGSGTSPTVVSNEKVESKNEDTSSYKPSGPKKTIIVDPGHGGHDAGAQGNGYQEKELALSVSQYLVKELEKDYNVIITRNSDYFIPLKERAEIGNQANADLFVSVHFNSASSSSGNGMEVFYYSRKESEYAKTVADLENGVDTSFADQPFTDFIISDIMYEINQEESAKIANTVLNNMVSDVGLRKRGTFGANFSVLRNSESPAILVEVGFISNPGDMSYFGISSYRETVAKSIANGIRQHLR